MFNHAVPRYRLANTLSVHMKPKKSQMNAHWKLATLANI